MQISPKANVREETTIIFTQMKIRKEPVKMEQTNEFQPK